MDERPHTQIQTHTLSTLINSQNVSFRVSTKRNMSSSRGPAFGEDPRAAFGGARGGTAPHGESSQQWGEAWNPRSSISRGSAASSNQLAELNQALKYSSGSGTPSHSILEETIVRIDDGTSSSREGSPLSMSFMPSPGRGLLGQKGSSQGGGAMWGFEPASLQGRRRSPGSGSPSQLAPSGRNPSSSAFTHASSPGSGGAARDARSLPAEARERRERVADELKFEWQAEQELERHRRKVHQRVEGRADNKGAHFRSRSASSYRRSRSARRGPQLLQDGRGAAQTDSAEGEKEERDERIRAELEGIAVGHGAGLARGSGSGHHQFMERERRAPRATPPLLRVGSARPDHRSYFGISGGAVGNSVGAQQDGRGIGELERPPSRQSSAFPTHLADVQLGAHDTAFQDGIAPAHGTGGHSSASEGLQDELTHQRTTVTRTPAASQSRPPSRRSRKKSKESKAAGKAPGSAKLNKGTKKLAGGDTWVHQKHEKHSLVVGGLLAAPGPSVERAAVATAGVTSQFEGGGTAAGLASGEDPGAVGRSQVGDPVADGFAAIAIDDSVPPPFTVEVTHSTPTKVRAVLAVLITVPQVCDQKLQVSFRNASALVEAMAQPH